MNETHRRRLGFSNFDVPLEHRGIHETQREGGHRHRHGNRDEIEDGLVAEVLEVIQGVGGMSERIDDHPALDPRGAQLVSRFVHIAHFLERPRTAAVLLAAPYLARPEESTLVHVLAEVADDIGLLEQESDRIGYLELGREPVGFFARGGKEAGEALANEAGDVVAVEVVFPDAVEVDGARRSGFVGVVGHAGFHFETYVDDDGFVSGRELGLGSGNDEGGEQHVRRQETVDFLDDSLVFDEKLPVFLGGAAIVVVPTWRDGVDMERTENGLLDVVWDGHVVLDGIETTQNEVEKTDLRRHEASKFRES